MSNAIEVKVPDIGDFTDVPVIEILVKVGDPIKAEDPLVMLESDKATMEVPAPRDGVVKEIRIQVGDKVSQGTTILTLEATGAALAEAPKEKITEGGRPTAAGAPAADYGAAGVYETVDVRVPDIGDFGEVPVIEVLVKVGDTIRAEDPLVTLESDKATMDVPAPLSGTVAEIKLKVGDKVSEGSVILTLKTGVTAAAPTAPAAHAPAAAAPAVPVAAPLPAGSYAGTADIECEMLVLGAGPGGYSAAFRSADLGMKTVLVERYATLGGVCLNVGCIPSKALLHTASVVDEAKAMAHHGISFGAPEIDIDKLRGFKEGVVKKLTGGLAGMAKARKVEVVRGSGRFLDPHHLEVDLTEGDGQEKTGAKKVVRFQKAIIAAGSQAVPLPFMPVDPRVVDSSGALALQSVPKRMLVIGGGIIGLEMATVYSTLGTRIDVVEMLDGMMAGADRDLVKVWEKMNASRFDNVMLKTKTVGAKATPQGIEVSFEGEKAPSEPQSYDLVLVAVGRSPNGKKIDAEQAGVAVSERGFIPVDNQMRTNVAHIFAIGDIVGQPMLAHKAVHEAHVAAEVAAGEASYFDARQIPSVAYTDPEVAWAGKTEEQCKAEGIKYGKAVFPWAASGRAIANGRDEGFTKLLFDETTHRCIGGGIVGTHAGDLISEVCLAVEMGCDPTDIGKTIHPHPTLGESIGMAAELFEGVCTDLPPMKKK
ncbi:dihydrolipoyl dehydrogenase [Paraburkholderia sp. 1N]|uniref:Dihydrolipoyl dehydrogenase n=1 Tax=Paraburkholderia solitsugae TaxID=2675748 RepID=A0ABX2BRA8_9BURK|nr:dihydrolipoyl dehydrogenase [Paraburkholderia solitsugae]NPT42476.1 dihydrolipoyl dehydrogenase [Paraburkholderia solitsugae]